MATVIIPEELEQRLSAIAEAKRISVESLTTATLMEIIEEQVRHRREKNEDETRWQRYFRTGESISRVDMSRKLQYLATQAVIKAN